MADIDGERHLEGPMAVPAVSLPADATAPGQVERLRATAAAVGATVLGAAPHVLHHVGPLAGAAVLAGATGKLLFGVIGFVLAVPMLRRMRRRRGSWRAPGAVLALMAIVFAFSSFVIGPALTGSSDSGGPAQAVPGAPPGVTPAEHEQHHQ